jgi:hypothetical protein
MDKCATDPPPLGEIDPGHWVACHLHPVPASAGSPTGPTPVTIGRVPA